jgi:hypothetical protein
MDDGVRPADGAGQKCVRRDRHDLGIVHRDVPDGRRTHRGTAHEVHGPGSPQWQIDALWRFQIPEELRKKYGYPELTQDAKRKILGLNSAKLYGIGTSGNLQQRFKPVPKDYEQRIPDGLKKILELPPFSADNLSRIREQYAALDLEPTLTRYGWIHL